VADFKTVTIGHSDTPPGFKLIVLAIYIIIFTGGLFNNWFIILCCKCLVKVKKGDDTADILRFISTSPGEFFYNLPVVSSYRLTVSMAEGL
jgi:hypothetical protein